MAQDYIATAQAGLVMAQVKTASAQVSNRNGHGDSLYRECTAPNAKFNLQICQAFDISANQDLFNCYAERPPLSVHESSQPVQSYN